MKHILILIYGLSRGGAERSTANIANALSLIDYRVTVATLEPLGDDNYAMNQSIRHICLNVGKGVFGRLKQLWATRILIRTEKPDVIISLLPEQNVIAIAASLGLPSRVLALERSYPPLDPHGLAWDYLRKYSYRLADTVVVQTKETAEWIQHNTYASNVVVIPNFVVWPMVISQPVVKIERVIDKESKLILAVGRDSKIKGFDLLIRAFAAITDPANDWVLAIAGLEDATEYIELSEECDIRDRVLFPGRVGNIEDWYERADIFVLSSISEGFPNVLLEAMATGSCVVAFDCNTGPRDMIRHDIDGVLVPPADIQALSRALNDLIHDDQRRAKLASKATDVKTRFSRESILEKWRLLL